MIETIFLELFCFIISPFIVLVIASRLPCLALEIIGMHPDLIASMSVIGKPSPLDGSKKILASESICLEISRLTGPMCLIRESLGKQSSM